MGTEAILSSVSKDRAVDQRFMNRALALAAQADGRTRPNPMVGAVVVRGAHPVGEGWHCRAGESHAEVLALQSAGEKSKGSTLYVTLEPCVHHGRTPPCVDAVVKAGISRVVYGMRDPNPLVRGRGVAALRRAGIVVDGPVLAGKCKSLNRRYCRWITTGLPYVICKVGSTLDGKIADRHGSARWITNAETRQYTHQWRSRVDAVLVGVTTVRRDNPRLTVRLSDYSGPQPESIIWIGSGKIPWASRLLSRKTPKSWCVVDRPRPRAQRKLEQIGHEMLVANSVKRLLMHLGRNGISSLMIEGGSYTIGSFLRAGAVDYAVVTLAPKLLGRDALGWTDGARWSLQNSAQLQVEKILCLGDNVVIEGELGKRGSA